MQHIHNLLRGPTITDNMCVQLDKKSCQCVKDRLYEELVGPTSDRPVCVPSETKYCILWCTGYMSLNIDKGKDPVVVVADRIKKAMF